MDPIAIDNNFLLHSYIRTKWRQCVPNNSVVGIFFFFFEIRSKKKIESLDAESREISKLDPFDREKLEVRPPRIPVTTVRNYFLFFFASTGGVVFIVVIFRNRWIYRAEQYVIVIRRYRRGRKLCQRICYKRSPLQSHGRPMWKTVLRETRRIIIIIIIHERTVHYRSNVCVRFERLNLCWEILRETT